MLEEIDLRELATRLGIPLEESVAGIQRALSDEDDVESFVAGVLDEDMVGKIILRSVPGITKKDVAPAAKVIAGRFDGMDKLYATAAATMAAAKNMRANSAVTLYATNVGVQVTAGTRYNLYPRTEGQLTSKYFRFQPTMIFFRAIIDPRDCAAGFTLPGKSFGFANERAKPFDYDIGLTLIRPEIPIEETPLASLARRSPTADTDFEAAIRLDATTNSTFYGITLLYWDHECSNSLNRFFGQQIGSASFADLVKQMGSIVRRTPVRRRVAY